MCGEVGGKWGVSRGGRVKEDCLESLRGRGNAKLTVGLTSWPQNTSHEGAFPDKTEWSA